MEKSIGLSDICRIRMRPKNNLLCLSVALSPVSVLEQGTYHLWVLINLRCCVRFFNCNSIHPAHGHQNGEFKRDLSYVQDLEILGIYIFTLICKMIGRSKVIIC